MSIEISVTVKDEEKRKLSNEFLIYEDVTFKQGDPILESCVKELLDEFKGVPDDVIIRAKMQWVV